jgi:membrane fusion protein (multidrug efflux system)
MKIKNCMFVALAALALASCGKKSGGSLADLQDNEFPVCTVGESSANMQTTYPATIKGIQDVEVHPKLSGYITNVYVHEGQAVRAGQVMFTIDSETYRAAVLQSEAALNTAVAQANTTRLTYLNNKKLFAQHIIGQYELETALNSYKTAEAQVAQARASLVSARETLSWCTVTAPVSGVVGSLPFKKGALVSAQSTLTTVSDVSTVEVFFSMSEPDILSMSKTAGSVAGVLREMPTVKLQLADGTTYNQPGRVVKMSGVIDATTGAYTLIAHFPNPQGLLKSGGAGQIIVPHVSNNIISIPQEATSQVQDKYFVYKLDKDNKVRYTEIKVNPQNDGVNYVVTSGLNIGDRYVSKGLSKLTDGEQIKPITEAQYQKKIDDAANLSKEQGTAKGFVKAMSGK